MPTQQQVETRVGRFVERCRSRGIPVTHQRRVIFRVIAETGEHPSPESVYESVRREIPAISLATVYKNIGFFRELGLIREVSGGLATQRLDANLEPHHHLVCTACRMVIDLHDDELDRLSRRCLVPQEFEVESYQVQVLGRCSACRDRMSRDGLEA